MQTFMSTVRCAICKRLLARATGIPQADCAQAAEAATHVLACPERGHMRNSCLIFGWDPEPVSITAAPAPAAPVTPAAQIEPIASPPAEIAEDPTAAAQQDPRILSEDELSALIAEHEGRVSQDEIQEGGEGTDDGPITLNGDSPAHEPHDTADLAARVLSGEI